MINWVAGVGDVITCTPVRGLEHSIAISLAQQQKPRHATCSYYRTPSTGCRENSKTKRSALQRHCDFWDTDHDSLIYPWDIFIGFRKLGFNMALCLWAAVTMAICSSYSTQTSWLPHPLFAINTDNIHRSRHGSTTGVYDLNEEIDWQRFDAVFEKYARGEDYLTARTVYEVWAGQCVANDWFGWFAGGLEWIALYILLWPEDGKMRKEDIMGVFDGSIFQVIADKRAGGRKPESAL